MTNVIKFVLVLPLLAALLGCSAESAGVAADVGSPRAAAVTPKAKLVIPSGTQFRVSLIDAINTDTSSVGDHFFASLQEPILVNGVTALVKGTRVRGRVLDVADSGRVKGRASISLALTDIVQGDRMIAIATDTFGATADSTQKRDAGIIAGGAGVGAIIGAVTGGKKGAAIGAATGGGAGTGVVLATKGNEIHYGPETSLNFTLTKSVQL